LVWVTWERKPAAGGGSYSRLMLVGGGALWWSAVSARDDALTDLKAEQDVSAELRASVMAQNFAIIALGSEKLKAEARGLAAQQLAQRMAGVSTARCSS